MEKSKQLLGNSISNTDFRIKAATGCFIYGDKSYFKAQCPKTNKIGNINRGRDKSYYDVRKFQNPHHEKV